MDNIIQMSYGYYNKALEMVKKNNIEDAKINLEKAIKLYCKDTEILNLLGCCEYLLCNFDKSNFYWNESIKVDSFNNKAIDYVNYLDSEKFKNLLLTYNKAIDLLNNRSLEYAIILLKEVIGLDNNLIEPYYIVGVCYFYLKDYNLSLKYLKIANKKDSGNLSYLEFIDKVRDCKPKEIIIKNNDKFKYIIPVSVLIIMLISGVYIYKYGNESSKYDNLLKEKNKEYNSIISQLNNEKDINKELSRNLNIINDSNINLIESLFEKSLFYYKNARYKEAIEGFEYILKQEKEEDYIRSESMYLVAVSYEKLEKYDLAVTYYKEYVDKYYKCNYYDDSLYNLGMIMYENNNYDEAKTFLQKLKNEMPNSIYMNSQVELVLTGNL